MNYSFVLIRCHYIMGNETSAKVPFLSLLGNQKTIRGLSFLCARNSGSLLKNILTKLISQEGYIPS
jgi:hypothetical protein